MGRQRLLASRALLENTRLPVDEVLRTRFSSGAVLRRRFNAVMGVSPRTYRTPSA